MGQCLSASAKHGDAPAAIQDVQIVTVAKGVHAAPSKANLCAELPEATKEHKEHDDGDSAIDSTFATCHDDAAKNWRPACGADPGKWHASMGGKPWDVNELGPPGAPNNEMRHLTYKAMGLSDAPPCGEIDVVLKALCVVFQAPYASLALYTDGRCWLTNTVAMPGGNLAWRVSACPWNLLVPQPQTLVCGDLKEDARFENQPWTLSGLRCYCSAPMLASNGHRLGTICFMDKEPRLVDAGMCRVLNNFGEIAVRVLERHVGLAQRLQAAQLALPPQLARLQLAASTGLPEPGSDALSLPGPEFGYWGSSAPQSKSGVLNSRNSASSQQAVLGGKAGSTAVSTATPRSVGAAATSRALSEKSAPGAPTPSTAANSKGSTTSVHSSAHNSAGAATDAGAPPSVVEDAVPEDVLVMNAFWRQLRSQERTFEACVLLVDTSKPGWPVIFVDETWRLWSGYSRDHIVGRPLSDLVAPAALSVAPPAWGAMQLEAARGCRFLVPGMVAVVPEGVTATPFSTSTPVPATLVVNKATGKPSSKGMANDLDDPQFLKKGKDTAGKAVPANGAGRFDSANGSSTTELLLEQVLETERAQQSARKSQESAVTAALLNTGGSSVASGPHASRMAAHTSMDTTQSGSSATFVQKGRVFDLSFRPAALDLLDADTLPLGMPSFVPMAACTEVLGLYAVRLHNPTDIAPPQAVLMPTTKIFRTTDAMPVHLAPKFFPGLKLSQVLGSGGYGTAYFGNWHDTDVVVKVQDHTLRNTEALNEAQLEISLGQLLSHPNLVRTLAHAAAELPAPVPAKPKGASGTMAKSGRMGTPPGPRTPPVGTPGPVAAPPPSPAVPFSQPFGSAGDEAPLANELLAVAQDNDFEWTSGYDEADPDKWFSNCEPSMRRGPPLLRPPTIQMSDTTEGSASFPTGAIAGGNSFLAPVSEVAPLSGAGPGNKQAVGAEDVHLDVKHQQGGAAAPGDTSGSSTLAGNMQYVAMAGIGPAAAAPDTPDQNGGLAPAPADAVWYSVPMQLPGAPLLEFHKDRAAHSAMPGAAAASHMSGDTTSSGGLAPAGMTFINMAGQHAVPQFPANNSGSSGNFNGFSTTDSGKAFSPMFLHNHGVTAKGSAHHPSKATVFNSGLMRTQMSEMRTASELAMSGSNHKAPRFPMKIRTFALLEFCDGGSLQDAVDRGWLRHGSCSLLAPINLPKVIKLALDITSGLAYLHMCGVVHADLSANNILLCRVKPSADSSTALNGKVSGTSGGINSKSAGAVLKAQGIVAPRQTSQNSHEMSAGSGVTSTLQGCGPNLTAAAAACAMPSINSINTTVAVTPPATRFMIAPAVPRVADEMEFTAKISDFGKSQVLSPEGIIQVGGYATVTHMAPEVLTDHLLSPGADMYSFGVLLWQMLTGSRPWAGLGHTQILHIVTSGALQLEWPEPPTGSFDSETWKGIVAVGSACLARKREDRPSAEEVQAKLKALLQTAPLVGDL